MEVSLCLQNKTAVKYDEMSDSDDEKGDHDAYLERMKREGKERVEVDEDDDDDDSSGNPFFQEQLSFLCLVVHC